MWMHILNLAAARLKKTEKIGCLCAETSMWFSQRIKCYMHTSIRNQVPHADVCFIYKKGPLLFWQLSKNEWKIIMLDLLLSFSLTKGIKVSTLVSCSHPVVRGGNEWCTLQPEKMHWFYWRDGLRQSWPMTCKGHIVLNVYTVVHISTRRKEKHQFTKWS